jgi:hypothetical protein
MGILKELKQFTARGMIEIQACMLGDSQLPKSERTPEPLKMASVMGLRV